MPTSLPRSSAPRAMRAAAAISDSAPQTLSAGKRRSAQRRVRPPASAAIPVQSRIVFRAGAISLR